MGDTSISWTNKTWNPVVGCAYQSEGCRGCYAARDAFGRLKTNPTYAGLADRDGATLLPRFTGEIRLLDGHNPEWGDRLDQPLSWRDRYMVFVNSMSDLFHPDVPDDFIAKVYARMAIAGHLTFQVLTKRPQRAARLLNSAAFVSTWRDLRHERAVQDDVQRLWSRNDMAGWPAGSAIVWPPPNVWLGTSIELNKYVDVRVKALAQAAAAVRFLSVEPLIGPVDLAGPLGLEAPLVDHPAGVPAERPKVDWVIVGGESGPQARPMHPQWARVIRDQCAAAGVPFHFKQWGEWSLGASTREGPRRALVYRSGHHVLLRDDEQVRQMWLFGGDLAVMHRAPGGVKKAGRRLDGNVHDAHPPISEASYA